MGYGDLAACLKQPLHIHPAALKELQDPQHEKDDKAALQPCRKIAVFPPPNPNTAMIPDQNRVKPLPGGCSRGDMVQRPSGKLPTTRV